MLIIISVFACGFSLNFIQKNFIYKTDYDEYVDQYSAEYNVDKALIYSVIKCESSYDKDVLSDVGAIGLMQITPETFDWMLSKTGEKYTHDDLYIPEVNIKNNIAIINAAAVPKSGCFIINNTGIIANNINIANFQILFISLLPFT